MFWPTFWDLAFLAGSVGLFFLMFLLFTRLLPVLSMFELRKLAHQTGSGAVGRGAGP
jgi:molybdopterin-containing oxidoreductase family membrane subunit